MILWEALHGLYDALGFAAVDEDAFRALVLGRIVEPTSKLGTVWVLDELGVPAPSRVTFMRCLKRVVAKDYRSVIAAACYRHAAGGLALMLYDVTVRHEALVIRVEVRDLRRGAAVAVAVAVGGQLNRGDAREGASSPDKAVSRQHCRMAWARRACRRSIREPPGCIEAAAQYLASEPASVTRALTTHQGDRDGWCRGCDRTVRWPCAVASIAQRAQALLTRSASR